MSNWTVIEYVALAGLLMALIALINAVFRLRKAVSRNRHLSHKAFVFIVNPNPAWQFVLGTVLHGEGKICRFKNILEIEHHLKAGVLPSVLVLGGIRATELSPLHRILEAYGIQNKAGKIYFHSDVKDSLRLTGSGYVDFVLSQPFDPMVLKNMVRDFVHDSAVKAAYSNIPTTHSFEQELYRYRMPFFKRVLDVVISSLLLIFLSWLFIVLAILIRLESRGPIFYRSKRAGQGFKVIPFYKFRTMVVNADRDIMALAYLNQYAADSQKPVFFKISNDPRLTRIGSFLRKTGMDELPQLFNVFLGSMSLVGNRPLPLYEASTLTVDDFIERFTAPSGMSGLWQLKSRMDSDMSMQERIDLDIYYARKTNWVYDCWILINTALVLVFNKDFSPPIPAIEKKNYSEVPLVTIDFSNADEPRVTVEDFSTQG